MRHSGIRAVFTPERFPPESPTTGTTSTPEYSHHPPLVPMAPLHHSNTASIGSALHCCIHCAVASIESPQQPQASSASIWAQTLRPQTYWRATGRLLATVNTKVEGRNRWTSKKSLEAPRGTRPMTRGPFRSNHRASCCTIALRLPHSTHCTAIAPHLLCKAKGAGEPPETGSKQKRQKQQVEKEAEAAGEKECYVADCKQPRYKNGNWALS